MTRPHCKSPDACIAKGAGHCRRCGMSATISKLNADPAFAARRDKASSERLRKLSSDPEFAKARDERSAERMRKLHADKTAEKLARMDDAARAVYTRAVSDGLSGRLALQLARDDMGMRQKRRALPHHSFNYATLP